MKVNGTSGTTSAGGVRGARPGGGGEGFRIACPQGASGAAPATATSSVGGVMGLEALLALQDVGGPLDRRRRQVGRAGRILDVLDGVKVALLDGEISTDHLDRLTRAIRDQREQTDDEGLDALLDDIELRAAVEMAKLERMRAV